MTLFSHAVLTSSISAEFLQKEGEVIGDGSGDIVCSLVEGYLDGVVVVY